LQLFVLFHKVELKFEHLWDWTSARLSNQNRCWYRIGSAWSQYLYWPMILQVIFLLPHNRPSGNVHLSVTFILS